MVAKGLVQRLPDPGDRRRITLAMTPEGFAVLERADAAASSRLATVASYLSADDAGRALGGLTLWTEALRAEAAPAVQPVVRVEAAQPAVPA